MKRYLCILIGLLSIATECKAQTNSISSEESADFEYKKIDATISMNMKGSSMDTIFYDNGLVQTISIHIKESRPVDYGMTSKSELVEVVYQYDQCGQLRSIAKVMAVTYVEENTSCWSAALFPPYNVETNTLELVKCDIPWKKPLLSH